jgi:hypothetical protein
MVFLEGDPPPADQEYLALVHILPTGTGRVVRISLEPGELRVYAQADQWVRWVPVVFHHLQAPRAETIFR